MNGAYFYEDEDSTGKYILPNKAIKSKYKEAFRCCDCNESLVLCKGDKNVDYFRHYKDTTCNRYEKPLIKNEKKRIHEEAKLQLKSWIEQEKVIRIKRRCCCCKQDEYECYTTIFDMLTKVKLEHRYIFNDRNIFYDVAHLTYKDEIIEAFEIVDTHKTEEENRPDNIKWFEISASEIMKKAMEHFDNNYEIILNNERAFTCNECVIKLKEKKIEDDIREEEIRCMRQETILKKQRKDDAIKSINLYKEELKQEELKKEKEQELKKQEYLIIIKNFLDGISNDNELYINDVLYKELFDKEQNRRTNIEKIKLKIQQDKDETLLKELKYKEDIVLRERDLRENIDLQRQIKKAMCNDIELAEYISLLDKKLNYEQYKRLKVLKTSYWYYKQEALNEMKKEMSYDYENELRKQLFDDNES